MHSSPNLIPMAKGKYGETLLRDEKRLNIDTDANMVPPFSNTKRNNQAKKLAKLRKMRRIFKKVTDAILYDKLLKFRTGNPPYYPPVPKYMPPEGKRYTFKEIRGIQQKMRNTEDKPNFVRDNITLTDSVLGVEEFNATFDSCDQYFDALVFDGKDIDVITGFQRTKNFSYPIIQTKVGFRIAQLFNRETGTMELSGIYVLKNKKIIELLLERLASIEVSNIDDLIEAKIALSELYWQLESRSNQQ